MNIIFYRQSKRSPKFDIWFIGTRGKNTDAAVVANVACDLLPTKEEKRLLDQRFVLLIADRPHINVSIVGSNCDKFIIVPGETSALKSVECVAVVLSVEQRLGWDRDWIILCWWRIENDGEWDRSLGVESYTRSSLSTRKSIKTPVIIGWHVITILKNTHIKLYATVLYSWDLTI